MMFALTVISVILRVKIHLINVLIYYTENGRPMLKVREEDCVGCNLCSIVCPVEGAISMVELKNTITTNDME